MTIEVVGAALIGLGIVVLFMLGSRRTKRDCIQPLPSEEFLSGSFPTRYKPESALQRAASVLGRAMAILLGFGFPLAFIGLFAWPYFSAAPPTVAQKQREAENNRLNHQDWETKRDLCRVAAECRKYDQVRLECATAGNFATCMRIKMGNASYYEDSCSPTEGGPATPPAAGTPNAIECFVRAMIPDFWNEPTRETSTLSQVEILEMKNRLASLWNIKTPVENPTELKVTIRVRLNRDGRLAEPPKVVSTGNSERYKAAAEEALQAVIKGQPYTMLREESYDQWKYMDIDFDPNELITGR